MVSGSGRRGSNSLHVSIASLLYAIGRSDIVAIPERPLLSPVKETEMNYATVRALAAIAIALMATIMITAPCAQAEVKRYGVPAGDSPVIGPDKAAVTIIEFIDYQ